MQTIKMTNGIEIPQIGFGTWQMPSGTITRESVRFALEAGYRHIDTAAAYYNEESVGQGIAESGIARSEIFLTTKLHNEDHGYELTRAGFEKSLKALGVDYIDLYLIHWPNPIAHRHHWQEANAGSWRAMEEFYRAGLVKSIGISNFAERHIEELMKSATITPMVNQIRLFAGERQEALVSYCRNMGMVLEAYSPLGTGNLLKNPTIAAVARAHGRSGAQISLRYLIQKGFVVLPKSIRDETIRENLNVFDFSLSE
ncbi:MAG: aldo/keto reductase, partial [Sphaerochaeta sp.]|nr:aldo/keto reductase [Sphaerochaeta sp.]